MTNPPGGGREVYAALGDSISIDVYAGGPGRGGASLLARNRDDDFPEWRGLDLATTRLSCASNCSPPMAGTPRRC